MHPLPALLQDAYDGYALHLNVNANGHAFCFYRFPLRLLLYAVHSYRSGHDWNDLTHQQRANW